MMEIISWFEEYRQDPDDKETAAKTQAEAIADEATWRATGECSNDEDQIMHVYAYQCMEQELFSLGAYIEKKYPDAEDRWWLAESVYNHFGTFCMMARRPAEAVDWFLKALEFEQPYPYPTWERLAAAYVEIRNFEQADLWIEKYLAHYRADKDRISRHEWEGFAKYYHETGRQERALELLLEIANSTKYLGNTYFSLLGKVYILLEDFDKAIEVLEQQVTNYKRDAHAFTNLAVAYYNGYRNLEKAVENYLKSIEFTKELFTNYIEWNAAVYEILAILYADNNVWDQCFYYLKQQYSTKYPPDEAAIFIDMIDQMPEIENDDMGQELFDIIRAFESGVLRPTSDRFVEEKALENPADEVKDASKDKDNRPPLFNLDDLSEN